MSDLKERRSQMIKGVQDSLRIIRQVVDISAQELGDYIGVSRQTINNIETRKTTLNATQYIAISALLDRKIKKNEGSLEQIKAVLKAHSENSAEEAIQLKDNSFIEGWFKTYDDLHIDKELIKSKVLDNVDLTALCENYKLFFTKDVFESEVIEQFIFKLIPYLTDANAQILMPDVATDAIENKTMSSDEEVAAKAKRTVNILMSLQKAGLLSIRGDHQERDEEEVLKDVIMKHKDSYSIALFTQNKAFAEKILAMNDIKTDETFPIIVCNINQDGNAERSLLDEDEDVLIALKDLFSERHVKELDETVEDDREYIESKEYEEELNENDAPRSFRPIETIVGWEM